MDRLLRPRSRPGTQYLRRALWPGRRLAAGGPALRLDRQAALVVERPELVFLFQRGRLPMYLEPGFQRRLRSYDRAPPGDTSFAQRQAVRDEHLAAGKDFLSYRQSYLPQSRRKLGVHLDEYIARQIESRPGWRTLQRAAVGFSRQLRGRRVALGHGELKFAAAR